MFMYESLRKTGKSAEDVKTTENKYKGNLGRLIDVRYMV